MEMEEKKNELTEAALPVQELPADIPDEVRQKLAKDLNEEATEGPEAGYVGRQSGRKPMTKRSRQTPRC